jgi:hypothetical protein
MSSNLSEHFIVDADGNKINVVLAIETYHQLLDQVDEFQCLKAYDRAVCETSLEIASGVFINLETYLAIKR